MSRLFLVRHGQASAFTDNYDRLSDLGHAQSRALGEYWAARQMRWQNVFTGSLTRQQQTWTTVRLALPDDAPVEARTLPELDEHAAIAVVKTVRGETSMTALAEVRHDPAALTREFREHLAVMRQWAVGELDVPGHESWRESRQRAARALKTMTQLPGPGANVLAFSSAGLISMIVGTILDLSDDKVFDLSTGIQNCSITEIRFDNERTSLVSFNTVPHLHREDWITLF